MRTASSGQGWRPIGGEERPGASVAASERDGARPGSFFVTQRWRTHTQTYPVSAFAQTKRAGCGGHFNEKPMEGILLQMCHHGGGTGGGELYVTT